MIELRTVIKHARYILLITKRPWIEKSTIRATWDGDARRVYCNTEDELMNLKNSLRNRFGIHTTIEYSPFPPENMGKKEEVRPRDIQRLFHLPTYHRHFGILVTKEPEGYVRRALEKLRKDWNVLMEVENKSYILR